MHGQNHIKFVSDIQSLFFDKILIYLSTMDTYKPAPFGMGIGTLKKERPGDTEREAKELQFKKTHTHIYMYVCMYVYTSIKIYIYLYLYTRKRIIKKQNKME